MHGRLCLGAGWWSALCLGSIILAALARTELITKQEQSIAELKTKFENDKQEFAKPSPYEAQINELMRRSAELTTLINEETKKNQPGDGESVPVQAASVKHSSRR